MREINITRHPQFVNWVKVGREQIEQILDGPAVIAVLCNHGRHRSVAAAELLTETLRRKGYEAHVKHRDLNVRNAGCVWDCHKCQPSQRSEEAVRLFMSAWGK